MRDFLFYSFLKVSVLKEILTLDAAASWEIAVQRCYIFGIFCVACSHFMLMLCCEMHDHLWGPRKVANDLKGKSLWDSKF